MCLDNGNYPASLERHKIYRALPDASASRHGQIRVIDESGEDYLYPQECFAAIQLPVAVERALRRAS